MDQVRKFSFYATKSIRTNSFGRRNYWYCVCYFNVITYDMSFEIPLGEEPRDSLLFYQDREAFSVVLATSERLRASKTHSL